MSPLLLAGIAWLAACFGLGIGIAIWLLGSVDVSDSEVVENWMEANRDEHL